MVAAAIVVRLGSQTNRLLHKTDLAVGARLGFDSHHREILVRPPPSKPRLHVVIVGYRTERLVVEGVESILGIARHIGPPVAEPVVQIDGVDLYTRWEHAGVAAQIERSRRLAA